MSIWNKVYQDFPINKKLVWLNNCGVTPISTPVKMAVQRYLTDFAEECIFTEEFAFEKVRQPIKEILASLIGAQAEEIVIIHNTAEGMNFIAGGYEFEAGDEVVVLEKEYPSNVYPWLALEEKGVKTIFVPLSDEPDSFLQLFKDSLSNRTKLVSISAVHWLTGMPLPLGEIGAICQSQGIDLVVDGAQGVGHIAIDVNKMHIDFMAFSAWKWLLGPVGLGAMYIRQEKLQKLKPIFMSTGSMNNDQEYLPYRQDLKPSAERYNYSTPNYLEWVYFLASLQYLKSIGFALVQERIYKLANVLSQNLIEIGFHVHRRNSWQASGIVVAQSPRHGSAAVVEYLTSHNIAASLRDGRIRFSPHAYNSVEQMNEVEQVLSRFS